MPESDNGDRIEDLILPETRYEGKKVDGLKEGQGIFTDEEGNRYEGNFTIDKKNGQGTMLYKDGTRYVGNFVNDMRESKGKIYYNNGEEYEGDFKIIFPKEMVLLKAQMVIFIQEILKM